MSEKSSPHNDNQTRKGEPLPKPNVWFGSREIRCREALLHKAAPQANTEERHNKTWTLAGWRGRSRYARHVFRIGSGCAVERPCRWLESDCE